jgi:hypothetical protein
LLASGDFAAPVGLDPLHVRRLWGLVLGMVAIAVVCLALGQVYVSGDGLMSAAFAAAAVTHFSSRPTRFEIVATVVLGAAFAAIGGATFALGGVHPVFDRAVSALGLASLVMQVARLVRTPPAQWTSERGGYAALTMLTPMFSLAFASSIALPGLLRADLYDAIAFNFDRVAFGGRPPPLVVGRWLAAHPWVAACATFVYWAPTPLNVLVYLAERRRRLRYDVILTLFIGGFLGYLVFPFFPVVGPGYVLPGYPWLDPSTALPVIGAIPASVPRNCMPSLHMGNALIVATHAWRLGTRGWRVVAVVDVVFTVIATLGFGYHYAADLVAALPFTWGVLGVARRDARQAAIGGGLTIAFLLLLRFAFRA